MKPMNSGLKLNNHALAPSRHKRSGVRGIVHRMNDACSTCEYFDKSLSEARQILEENQYPEWFVEPIINKTLEKIFLKRKKLDRLALDEKVTGKELFFIQCRGLDRM